MSLFGSIAKIGGDLLSGNFGGAAEDTIGAISGSDISGTDLLKTGASILGASSANSANRGIVQQQEAFQADMSGTAYQRGVADMEKAGLNPMLSYSQGGASTPSGSSAVMSDVITPAMNTATAAKNADTAFQSAQATIQNTNADTQLTKAQIAKTIADTAVSSATAKQVAASTALTQTDLPKAKNEAAAQGSWWNRNVAPYLPSLSSTAHGAASLIKAF